MIKSNKNLESLKEYKPSDRDSDALAKLDWNECNLPLDPAYSAALFRALEKINLTEYPSIDHAGLTQKLAAYCKVNPASVQVFNGSDSALNYVFTAFLNPDTRVLIYYPHYSQVETYIKVHTPHIFYSHISDVFGAHQYNFADIVNNDIIYFSNPNNPTGHYLEASVIETLLTQYPDKLFIVDEAYYEFCGRSAVALTQQYNNIVVSRTFSKAFSLASARLGYICCGAEIMSKVNKIRNTKEVNSFAQVLGEAALDNIDHINARVDLVRKNMEAFKSRLKAMNLQYVDSTANFVLVKVPDVHGLIRSLRDQQILVRDRSMFSGLEDCVRISIGTEDEMNNIAATIRTHLDAITV